MSDHHLTVLRDFGDYKRGEHIEDDSEIARILEGEMRHHVVKVAADPKPLNDNERGGMPPALPKPDHQEDPS